MSRIGKKPIIIPSGIEVKIEERKVTAKGPKGELSYNLPAGVKAEIQNGILTISAKERDKASRALWGTTRMHISNMIQGVNQGFSKQLQIEGIGYRANIEGENLMLQVGFTHPVKIPTEKDIKFQVEKNIITVFGIDKEKVSKIASQIKRVRPPEPYKGKGIRYFGEHIRKKVGKKAATGSAGGK